MECTGTFEVDLTPLDAHATGPDASTVGRMAITKTFHGGIVGTSRGEMLSVRLPNGAAGYVALEHVTAEIEGQRGEFVLQHFGTMSADAHRLILEVLPGSGTGALEGLEGSMDLEIEDGVHRYVFRYSRDGSLRRA